MGNCEQSAMAPKFDSSQRGISHMKMVCRNGALNVAGCLLCRNYYLRKEVKGIGHSPACVHVYGGGGKGNKRKGRTSRGTASAMHSWKQQKRSKDILAIAGTLESLNCSFTWKQKRMSIFGPCRHILPPLSYMRLYSENCPFEMSTIFMIFITPFCYLYAVDLFFFGLLDHAGTISLAFESVCSKRIINLRRRTVAGCSILFSRKRNFRSDLQVYFVRSSFFLFEVLFWQFSPYRFVVVLLR